MKIPPEIRKKPPPVGASYNGWMPVSAGCGSGRGSAPAGRRPRPARGRGAVDPPLLPPLAHRLRLLQHQPLRKVQYNTIYLLISESITFGRV